MKRPHDLLSLHSDTLDFLLVPTGDIFEMSSGSVLINQFRGNAKDGSANNIFLRIYENNKVKSVHPLLGQQSACHVSRSENCIRYEGRCAGIAYITDLFLVENSWFYEITLNSEDEITVDLLYGQDIGLSGKENVLTNELYTSQYLGHSVFEGEYGYTICSRQNMPDKGCNPYLQQGSLSHRIIHYATDGLDFFGLEYKKTNTPAALLNGLTDRNLQYEFAYSSLLTEPFTFSGSDTSVFYGHFLKHHREKITHPDFLTVIKEQYKQKHSGEGTFSPVQTYRIKEMYGAPLNSLEMSSDEIRRLYPQQLLAETKDSQIISFFTPDHSHVVTVKKEEEVIRPHGTIIITPPDGSTISNDLISSTHYMYGVFNSHVVLGNTNLHKLISTPRGFLNILKNSGQRIYVRKDRDFHLLSLPSLYEMGMNYSRWYYKTEDDLILVTAYCSSKNPIHEKALPQASQVHLEVLSVNGCKYDFIVTNQLSMGTNEFTHDILGTVTENKIHFPFQTDKYENLSYDIISHESCIISDDRIFYEEALPFDETFVTFSYTNTDTLHLTIGGSFDPNACISSIADFGKEKAYAMEQYASIMKHFHLYAPEENERLSILNETALWYTHNAMIHFLMPHGLEQPGGAAWGTRDICQGPFEYFLSTGNYGIIREILINIFSHQESATNEWPQWFMFDRYDMNAGECHGDVIFWPLKSLADYLTASQDYTILQEILPYGDNGEKKESLFSHIQAAVSQIQKDRFIPGTGLITYAGGDWDDTLQPENPEMKEKLVSTWTQALACQTFMILGEALSHYDAPFSRTLLDLGECTRKAFSDYAVKDHIIAGFLEWNETAKHLLHPADNETNIHYRLLPQTRSIIAELADQSQAAKNIEIIHQYLECPDGVRLMDAPASYDGGVSHLFKRAEQAANVGREISLQYSHAHIRYIEAMAKCGNAEKAWEGLFQINPVLIQKTVPNACLRQSNMYFSSSDGDYKDRYEYQQDFHLLRSGSIPVKGGWRLYSSGPGIYMHQLISHILGIRFQASAIIIDPVLPNYLGDFELSLECFGTVCTFHYRKSESNCVQLLHNGTDLKHTYCSNPYRSGGIKIDKNTFLSVKEKEFTVTY